MIPTAQAPDPTPRNSATQTLTADHPKRKIEGTSDRPPQMLKQLKKLTILRQTKLLQAKNWSGGRSPTKTINFTQTLLETGFMQPQNTYIVPRVARLHQPVKHKEYPGRPVLGLPLLVIELAIGDCDVSFGGQDCAQCVHPGVKIFELHRSQVAGNSV